MNRKDSMKKKCKQVFTDEQYDAIRANIEERITFGTVIEKWYDTKYLNDNQRRGIHTIVRDMLRKVAYGIAAGFVTVAAVSLIAIQVYRSVTCP